EQVLKPLAPLRIRLLAECLVQILDRSRAVARELTRERATRQGARVERLGRRRVRRRRRGDGRRRGGRRWRRRHGRRRRRLRGRRRRGGRPGWLRRLDRGPWRRCRGGWWRRDRCSGGEGGVEAQRLTLAPIEP